MSEPLRIFVSHSSTYVELAKSLKLSLQALESTVHLDIRISAEMAGATDWRQWIEENVRSADVFLFLYPHARMEMNWCNYELGRFYDDQKRHYIVCLKNLDIPKPPPAFEPYQAYDGDAEGLFKFLKELFTEGVFTGQQAVNAEVGKIGTDYYKRAREVAQELAEKFAQARVRERLYDRRIEITPQYTGAMLDRERTIVSGNVEGLQVIGLEPDSRMPLSTLISTLGSEHRWLVQLEESLSKIAIGALPPSLAPFHTAREIYVPVITRAENVDDVLRRVALIFITIPGEYMQTLADWVTPATMPENFAELIRLVRTLLRTRWDVLEPRSMEVRYGKLTKEQCSAVVSTIVADYERLAREMQAEGPMGPERFRSLFDRSLRPEFEATGRDFMESMQTLTSATDGGCVEIAKAIDRMLANNARWLQLAAHQFELHIGDLTVTSGEST
jgi:hypothetical protein